MLISEIISKIELLGKSSNLSCLLLMGSASRDEFSYYEDKGIVYYLSDLEILALYTKEFDRNKFEAGVLALEDEYCDIFNNSPDFKIEIDYLPKWRIRFLNNRLLFHEAIKASNYIIRNFEDLLNKVLDKKFDIAECAQVIIWRIFNLRMRLELNKIRYAAAPASYYIARNILDCLTVISYLLNFREVGFGSRNDKCFQILNAANIFDAVELEYFTDVFERSLLVKKNPKDVKVTVTVDEFKKCAHLVLKVIKKKGVKILPSRLDFLKIAITSFDFKSLAISMLPEKFFININEELLLDLDRLVKYCDHKNNLHFDAFIEKYGIFFHYLRGYREH